MSRAKSASYGTTKEAFHNTTEGMLLYDRSVDPDREFDLLERYRFPFIGLNVEGFMTPALETETARFVGEVLIEEFLRGWASDKAADAED